MTAYTKTMREALSEMYSINEDNMDLMRKAAKGAMQTIKFKDGKMHVDSFTASGIMQIYDKVNSQNKAKIEKIINHGGKQQILKLQSFAMSKLSGEATKFIRGEEVELEEATEKDILNTLKKDNIGGYFSGGKLYVAQRALETARDLLRSMKLKSMPQLVGEELEEAVQFEAPTKGGNTFQVIDRDTKGMRGSQDKFKMVVVDKKGKVVKDWGSHPSLDGAKKFAKNRKIIEEVELDEAKDIDPKTAKIIAKMIARGKFDYGFDYGLSRNDIDDIKKQGGKPPRGVGPDGGGHLEHLLKALGADNIYLDGPDLVDGDKTIGKWKGMSIGDVFKKARVRYEEVEVDEASLKIKQTPQGQAHHDQVYGSSKIKLNKLKKKPVVFKGSAKEIKKQMKDYKKKHDKLKIGEDVDLDEARQLKDPKKEMMVFKKGPGVIVIDKSEWEKYEKKGFTRAEAVELEHKGKKPHKHPHPARGPLAMVDEAKTATGYEIYHKTFSGAMQHAYAHAKKKFGITVDPAEIDSKVASGPKKPSSGKSNSYGLKGDKGGIQVQVYNTGSSKMPYELNMYKEEVELGEGKLPPHLAKFVDKKGNLNPDAEKRVQKGRNKKKFKDVTPKGYGPNEDVKLDEWTLSDVEAAMRKRHGKVDKEAIEKLRKVMYKGNVDRNDLVKVGYGKLHVESVELDEAIDYEIKNGKVHISKKEFARVSKDYKGKDTMTVLDPKTGATVNMPVVFEEVELDEASFEIKNDIVYISKDEYINLPAEGKGKDEDGNPTLNVFTTDDENEGPTPLPVKFINESAASDARRAMSRDKDWGKRTDSADIDDVATDDDIKGASKNIMMQLRKSMSLRGNFPVEFMDRKKVRIPAKIAQEVTKKYNALRRPKDKQEFQTRVSKSYKDMLTVVNESLKEGTWTLPNTPKQKAALKKLLSKPLKAKDATDKLYALIGDDEMFDDLDDYSDREPNDDVRPMVKSHMKRLGIKEDTILDRIAIKIQERKNG